jgi:hypothetical protein
MFSNREREMMNFSDGEIKKFPLLETAPAVLFPPLGHPPIRLLLYYRYAKVNIVKVSGILNGILVFIKRSHLQKSRNPVK